jgi:hypothetical protein
MTQLIPLSDVFEVTYGNKFDLNKMDISGKNTVAFVGRTAKNNGVTALVANVPRVDPYEGGLITVSLGGAILESFLQPFPFYTAQNVAILRPKKAMSDAEKIYYCLAIKANRFRYGAFGREANRTLKKLLVPVNVPKKFLELKKISFKATPMIKKRPLFSDREWTYFRFDNLFDIKKGKRLTKNEILPGITPFIGSTEQKNGVTRYISREPIHEGNTITVTYNGSVGEAFYQEKAFWASDDVNVLYPKFPLNKYIAFFLIGLIKKEKYRFNYGRKWHLERMRESRMRLPVDQSGVPDWKFMEDFIKSLSYSGVI